MIVVGEVRGAEAFELTRAVNAGCGFLCTVHANSANEAVNALVNAALMAGENVTERIVRKVFSEALDLVVQLDRDDIPSGTDGRIRRQVMEITAVAPTLSADQTYEPIFVREGLGRPLEWTGALPATLEQRVDRALPERSAPARAARAIARCGSREAPGRHRVGAFCALLAGALGGTLPRRGSAARRTSNRTERARAFGCNNRARASRLTQFVLASIAAGFLALVLVMALTGSLFVALVPAVDGRVAASRRTSVTAARSACARCSRRGPTGCATCSRRSPPGHSLTQAVTALATSRTADVARRVRTVPRPRACARDRRGAGDRQGRARRPDERSDPRGADPRARARRRDRPDDPRGSRRRDHEGPQAARRARDRGPRDADQRARRRRACRGWCSSRSPRARARFARSTNRVAAS